jgi:hypothetical protein
MKKSYPGVKQSTIDTINNFVTKGWEPGGFVTAVLENNLMEAFGRADEENRYSLFDICNYVYNEIPAGSHGSPAKVEAWMKYVRENPREVNDHVI